MSEDNVGVGRDSIDGAILGRFMSSEQPELGSISHSFAVNNESNFVAVHVPFMDSENNFALWDENELSDVLGVPVKTLQRWRAYGGGPRFVKLGRAARYRPAAVLAWLDEREVAQSSDLKKAS